MLSHTPSQSLCFILIFILLCFIRNGELGGFSELFPQKVVEATQSQRRPVFVFIEFCLTHQFVDVLFL